MNVKTSKIDARLLLRLSINPVQKIPLKCLEQMEQLSPADVSC